MVEYRLDCLYEACPIPLLKTMKKLKKLLPGDVLIVETDHACSLKNICQWVEKRDFLCEVREIANGQWEIFITKIGQ